MDALASQIKPMLLPAFTLWGSPVTWLEMVAFGLSVAMVLGNMRVQPVAWPLAIASSLLYFLLFHDARMYGEAGLQLLFVGLSFWGWWQWLRGTTADGKKLRVRTLTPEGRRRVVLLTAIAWPLLGTLLAARSDSDVPWWDALPTAGSLAGQWLLGRQYTENWLVWIAVNVISISLFAYKGLWLTVLLYIVFTAMAIIGWRQWRTLQASQSVPS